MGEKASVTTRDQVTIAFEVDGTGDPVILIHGVSEDRRSWHEATDILRAEYCIVRIDLRGHGESSRGSSYELRALASDIDCVLQALHIDAGNVNLVGHSLGGAVATFFASMFGACSVTNIDQPMNLDALVPLLAPFEQQLRGNAFSETLHAILSSLEGDKLRDDVRRELLAYHHNAKKDVVLGCWDLVFSQSAQSISTMVDSVLEDVRTPYLSLHGIDPGSSYGAWLSKRVPSAVNEVWPGYGHWLHRIDPARFVDRWRRFIRADF